jgi:hypothetical protein
MIKFNERMVAEVKGKRNSKSPPDTCQICRADCRGCSDDSQPHDKAKVRVKNYTTNDDKYFCLQYNGRPVIPTGEKGDKFLVDEMVEALQYSKQPTDCVKTRNDCYKLLGKKVHFFSDAARFDRLFPVALDKVTGHAPSEAPEKTHASVQPVARTKSAKRVTFQIDGSEQVSASTSSCIANNHVELQNQIDGISTKQVELQGQVDKTSADTSALASAMKINFTAIAEQVGQFVGACTNNVERQDKQMEAMAATVDAMAQNAKDTSEKVATLVGCQTQTNQQLALVGKTLVQHDGRLKQHEEQLEEHAEQIDKMQEQVDFLMSTMKKDQAQKDNINAERREDLSGPRNLFENSRYDKDASDIPAEIVIDAAVTRRFARYDDESVALSDASESQYSDAASVNSDAESLFLSKAAGPGALSHDAC